LAEMRSFCVAAVLSYRALFSWVQPASYIASKVLLPLEQILFFSLLGSYVRGPESIGYYLLGNSILVVATSGVYGVTMTIGGERRNGTLPYLFCTPVSRLSILLGRTMVHLLDGILGSGLALAFAVLLGLDLAGANWAMLALAIFVSTLSTSGLGLLLGSLSLVALGTMFLTNSAYCLLLFAAGANIPLDELPAAVQAVSQILPLTRGIAAGRLAAAGAAAGDIAPLLLGEIAVGLGYAALGWLSLIALERASRKWGTLDLM